MHIVISIVQDIITLVEYDDLMKCEDIENERNSKISVDSASTVESGICVKDSLNAADKLNDDIQVS